MLPVRDLDRTIEFYTRLLGMDIMRLRQQDETTRVGYLGYGSEDEGPALELVQSGGPTDPVQIPPWAGHFAIIVSDLNALCEKLKAAGVTFTRENNFGSGCTPESSGYCPYPIDHSHLRDIRTGLVYFPFINPDPTFIGTGNHF